jgi:hypothetical protein
MPDGVLILDTQQPTKSTGRRGMRVEHGWVSRIANDWAYGWHFSPHVSQCGSFRAMSHTLPGMGIEARIVPQHNDSAFPRRSTVSRVLERRNQLTWCDQQSSPMTAFWRFCLGQPRLLDVNCSVPRHVEQQHQRRSDDDCRPESIRYFVHSRFHDECRFSL